MTKLKRTAIASTYNRPEPTLFSDVSYDEMIDGMKYILGSNYILPKDGTPSDFFFGMYSLKFYYLRPDRLSDHGHGFSEGRKDIISKYKTLYSLYNHERRKEVPDPDVLYNDNFIKCAEVSSTNLTKYTKKLANHLKRWTTIPKPLAKGIPIHPWKVKTKEVTFKTKDMFIASCAKKFEKNYKPSLKVPLSNTSLKAFEEYLGHEPSPEDMVTFIYINSFKIPKGDISSTIIMMERYLGPYSMDFTLKRSLGWHFDLTLSGSLHKLKLVKSFLSSRCISNKFKKYTIHPMESSTVAIPKELSWYLFNSSKVLHYDGYNKKRSKLVGYNSVISYICNNFKEPFIGILVNLCNFCFLHMYTTNSLLHNPMERPKLYKAVAKELKPLPPRFIIPFLFDEFESITPSVLKTELNYMLAEIDTTTVAEMDTTTIPMAGKAEEVNSFDFLFEDLPLGPIDWDITIPIQIFADVFPSSNYTEYGPMPYEIYHSSITYDISIIDLMEGVSDTDKWETILSNFNRILKDCPGPVFAYSGFHASGRKLTGVKVSDFHLTKKDIQNRCINISDPKDVCIEVFKILADYIEFGSVMGDKEFKPLLGHPGAKHVLGRTPVDYTRSISLTVSVDSSYFEIASHRSTWGK